MSRAPSPATCWRSSVLDIKFRINWGWNVQRPLMGTLPEDFPFYRLTHIPIDRNRSVCTMPWGTEIQLRPFFGIMGVAPPPDWGQCSSIEPRAFGGNIDIKEWSVGTTLYLPVFADGGAVLDRRRPRRAGRRRGQPDRARDLPDRHLQVHRAQGHEVPHSARRDADPLHHHGLRPDLDDAAKEALRDMIRLICARPACRPRTPTCCAAWQATCTSPRLVDGNKGIHCMIEKKLIGG